MAPSWPLAAAEVRRLDTLDGFEITGTPPEPEFDRIAVLAARLLQTPAALICLVDERWVWVKGRVGTGFAGQPRTGSLYAEIIAASGGPMVADVKAWLRRGGKQPLDTECGFFAAAPILSADGEAVGVLCVLDGEGRASVSDHDLSALADLAAFASQQLEHRRRTIALERMNQHTARTDAVMQDVAHAPTCDDALARVLTRLSDHHHAAVGCIWALARPNNMLREVCRIPFRPAFQDHVELAGQSGLQPGNSIVAEIIVSGSPRAVRFAGVADVSRYPLVVSALRSGLHCQVVHPIHVSGERFAVSLTFDKDRTDLHLVLDDLASLTDAIRPALYRKVAEGQMHLLSTALDRANDAVMITEALPHDKGGPRIAYANASFCRATGYSAHEVVGRSPRMLLPADAGQRALARLDSALQGKAPARTEVEHRRKDGSRYWVEMDITPIADSSGGDGQRQWISIQRDISARRLADQARKEREVSNRTLFEQSPLPTLVFDRRSLRFLDVNGAAIRQYGWARTDFLAMSLPDVQVGDEQPAFGTLIAANMECEIAGRSWTHLRSDGSRFQVMVASHALTYAGEEAMMAVLQDVTEMEAARREMQVAHLRLADLATQLTARTAEQAEVHRLARLGTWKRRLGATESVWSDEMHEIIGLPKVNGPPTNERFMAQVHPDDRDSILATEKAVIERRTDKQLDFRVLLPGREIRHCRLDVRPVTDAAGTVTSLYGYCQDITARKEAELALLRSEKLNSIGQLTGGIAHDFNNLLTVVTLNLDEALEVLGTDEPLYEILQPAMHAALRGAELTRHLLSYARRATLRPEPVSLSTFFRTLQPLLTRTIGRAYDLQVRLGSSSDAYIDPAQLENAILNLVINARDAMPDGGCIQVSTALAPVGPPAQCAMQEPLDPAPPDELASGCYLMIRVADHGTGIPAETLARVFEPFFTTKDTGRGSGLGLSMVYGFARQSGGIADIASEIGVGTTVRLFLPIVIDADPDPDPAAGPPAASWQRQRLRVLVVDDEADVLTAATRMLSGMGFQVTSALTADDALMHLNGHADFDVLFSDVRLPGPVDGVELAAEARAHAPDIRVLLTSGYTDHSATALAATGAALPGNTRFLAKPYTRQALHAALSGLLGQD